MFNPKKLPDLTRHNGIVKGLEADINPGDFISFPERCLKQNYPFMNEGVRIISSRDIIYLGQKPAH